jgi:hypothetical protein
MKKGRRTSGASYNHAWQSNWSYQEGSFCQPGEPALACVALGPSASVAPHSPCIYLCDELNMVYNPVSKYRGTTIPHGQPNVSP